MPRQNSGRICARFRKRERVLEPDVLRHLADVVAVIERRHALAPEVEHRLDLHRHRALRRRDRALRVALAPLLPLGEAPAGRQIAVQRVVRRGLVGDDVGLDAPAHELGKDLGGVAEKADRKRFLSPARLLNHRQGFVEVARLPIEVLRAQPHLDPRRRALDCEHRGASHRRGERLRPAHAARPPVRIQRPARSPPECRRPTSAKVS